MRHVRMAVWLFILMDISGSTVDEESPWLYYSDGKVIHRWNQKTDAVQTVVNETSVNGTAKALDFDMAESKIFWTDYERELIHSGTLSSSGTVTGVTTVTRGVTSEGVAVDWTFKHLYWTDTSRPSIAVTDYNGLYTKTLITTDIDLPRAIVLDPDKGYLFWSDWGDVEKIERLSLDGEERLMLVSDDIFMPTGLVIDYTNGRLYWADAYFGHIKSCNLDGGEVKTVLSNPDFVSFPFGIALHNDMMFFTDWSNGTLRYFNVTNGGQQTVTARRGSMGVQLYESSRQQLGSGSFWASLCSCDYLCLPVTRNASCFIVSCVCPDGVSCNKTLVTKCPSNHTSDTSSSSEGLIIGCVVGALLLVTCIISVTLVCKHAVKTGVINIKPGLSNCIAKGTAKCESGETNGAMDGHTDETMDVDVRVLDETTKRCEPHDATNGLNEQNETVHEHLPSETNLGNTTDDARDIHDPSPW